MVTLFNVAGVCLVCSGLSNVHCFCDRNSVVVQERRVFKTNASGASQDAILYLSDVAYALFNAAAGQQQIGGRFLRPGRHGWPCSLLDSFVGWRQSWGWRQSLGLAAVSVFFMFDTSEVGLAPF